MMPRAIEYREYKPSDIGYVRDIIEYDLGYSVLPDELEGRINEMLSRNDYKIFVACDGEKTVGFVGMVSFIAFELKTKAAKITALAVSMEYRKNGIGTKLLNLVESYCRSNDIGLVSLNSGLPREDAHLFYESKGYIKKSYGFVKQIKY